MYANEPSLKTAEFSVAKKLSVYGTTEPRYFRTSSGWFCTASENEQKMMPSSASFSLNVVATETLSKTASTATPDSSFCSSSEMPSFSNVRADLGIDLVEALSAGFFGFGAE